MISCPVAVRKFGRVWALTGTSQMAPARAITTTTERILRNILTSWDHHTETGYAAQETSSVIPAGDGL
jgi:hypothetical protein